jgi:hypothetical protein
MVNKTEMHAKILSAREPRLKASALAKKQTTTRAAPVSRTVGEAGSIKNVPTPDLTIRAGQIAVKNKIANAARRNAIQPRRVGK